MVVPRELRVARALVAKRRVENVRTHLAVDHGISQFTHHTGVWLCVEPGRRLSASSQAASPSQSTPQKLGSGAV